MLQRDKGFRQADLTHMDADTEHEAVSICGSVRADVGIGSPDAQNAELRRRTASKKQRNF